MLNNGKNTTCGFSDEIVSYIYDEATPAGRKSFEAHLAGCALCADEFAGISEARLSMFEWQREAFSTLETPEIVIPYVKKAFRAEPIEPVGVFAGLRGWLTITNWPVTVAAVLVICAGLGLLAMTFIGRGATEVASNNMDKVAVAPVAIENKTVQPPEVAGVTVPLDPTPPTQNVASIKAVDTPRIRPNRPAVNPVQRRATELNAGRARVPQSRKPPVLNSYDDSDDRSLRLTDLFDDIGG